MRPHPIRVAAVFLAPDPAPARGCETGVRGAVYTSHVWRTVGFLLYFWPLLYLMTLAVLPLAMIFRLVGYPRLARQLLDESTARWSRHMLQVLGAKVCVLGRENLPDDSRICIVANHQSYGDSLMIQGYLGLVAGFVAKRELAAIPPLSLWMRSVGTVFVHRGDAKQARRVLLRAARNIAAGRPMAVFPEGTRSRGGPVGQFKAAALRLAWDSGATIVPVSLVGTANLLEKQGYLRSASVTMVIHPPCYAADYRRQGRQVLAVRLRETIISGFPG